MWVERFKEGGVAALRNLLRPGRPPKVERSEMEQIMGEASRSRITAVRCSRTYAKRPGLRSTSHASGSSSTTRMSGSFTSRVCRRILT